MGVGDLEWFSFEDEPVPASLPAPIMNFDNIEGSCKCFGLEKVEVAGLEGGEFSGLEAMGDRGLLNKNLDGLFGVNEGSGLSGAEWSVSSALL